MSDETKKDSTEANSSEDKLEQSTSFNVEVQAEAEASEEKKEVERPGSCCGSCS
jgi:CCGSCS motif protein